MGIGPDTGMATLGPSQRLSSAPPCDEAAETTPERVLRELWEDHFVLHPAAATPG